MLNLHVSVVVSIDEVSDVSVRQEAINFFGKTHQVYITLNGGMAVGLTDSFTFGGSRYMIRHCIFQVCHFAFCLIFSIALAMEII